MRYEVHVKHVERVLRHFLPDLIKKALTREQLVGGQRTDMRHASSHNAPGRPRAAVVAEVDDAILEAGDTLQR